MRNISGDETANIRIDLGTRFPLHFSLLQDETGKRSFIQQNYGNVVYVDREKALEQGEKLNVVGGPA